jgi:hypothetical protein
MLILRKGFMFGKLFFHKAYKIAINKAFSKYPVSIILVFLCKPCSLSAGFLIQKL